MKKVLLILTVIVIVAAIGVTARAKSAQKPVTEIYCPAVEVETQSEAASKVKAYKVGGETENRSAKKNPETESESESTQNDDLASEISQAEENPVKEAESQESVIEKLKAKYKIDDSYREKTESDYNGCTSYRFVKLDKNGVENPYDALSVCIDNTTGEIIAEKRFDKPAFKEAKLDKAEAKAAAEKSHPKADKNISLNIEDCILEYYMPKYPKGDIYLAYRVEFDDGNIVYVNAVSGEAVGFDQMK